MTSTPEWTTAKVRDAQTFVLDVNGQSREVVCRPDAPLLYLLRNDLGLSGARFGCGLGQCGACTVLLDGHPTPSCDLPAWSAEGHAIVTLEGLADDATMQGLQEAFVQQQAAQCGYCMSGILVTACAHLRTTDTPDEASVSTALERNLCRCGSHGRVLRAVLQAARGGGPDEGAAAEAGRVAQADGSS